MKWKPIARARCPNRAVIEATRLGLFRRAEDSPPYPEVHEKRGLCSGNSVPSETNSTENSGEPQNRK